MNLRSYLRGAGIGLIVAAIVLSFSGGNKSQAMTDDEIKSRARELGMTDANEVLTDVFETSEVALETGNVDSDILVNNETTSTEVPSVAAPAVETASTEAASTEAASAEAAATEAASDESASTEAASTEAASAETASAEASETPEASEPASIGTGDDSASTAEKTEAPTKTVDEIIEETLKDAPKDNIQSDLTGEEKSKSELLADAVETEAESAPAVTDNGSGFVSITVSSGSSSTAVAKALENAGAVSSAAAFDSYLCAKGYDRHLGTGEFRIPAGSSDEEIALILMKKK